MSEWRQIRLGQHADTFAGGTPNRADPSFFGGIIPWVKSTEINLGRIRQTEEFLTEKGLLYSAAKWIPAKTVLVAMYGATAAQIAFLEIEATANQAVLAIRPDEHLDPMFLFYALTSEKQRILFLAQGSGQPNLNKQIIDNLSINAPSLSEQRRIAEILAAVDEAIEATEALVGKYQQIKAGLLHDLFTRGLLPNGQLRPPWSQAPDLYQETDLGWIPKEWQVTNCSAEFSIDAGITLGPHRRPKQTAYPYLRVANVMRDKIVLDDIAQLEVFPGEIEKYALRKFDLLVVEGHANRYEIGRCAIVADNAEGMLFQNHLFRLRTKTISPEYALLGLNSLHSQRYWDRNCATSSGLNTINRRMLSAMFFCLPDISEQERIVFSACAQRSFEEITLRDLAKLQQLKQGLMQDLLTGRVPVIIHQT